MKMIEEVPKFIELRGCINCPVSKEHKERTGKAYGFDHELVAGCLISRCLNHSHALYNPFFDPEEVMRKAKETGNQEYIENAKKYLLNIKNRFGKFYRQIGVNLDELLEN